MKSIQKIPLQQIDLVDETFSVNFMPDLQRLRSSIERMGLIQPVILRKKQDGYQIICGFRRISVIHELGTTEIDSMVFEEKEMDEMKFFSLSLNENLTTRGFNPIEKAIALNKLIHHFQIDPTIVTKTFLPLFSLQPNEKILNTYLSLARMEDEVKKYVLEEEVSRSNIRRLSALSPDDRLALLPFLSRLKLGENRLRELLTLLEEISRRDRLMIRDIVRGEKIKTILFQKELTPSQKEERVKKVLTDLRFPRMQQMEEGFEKKRKKLNLPPGVFLNHQPFFEESGCKVAFQFKRIEEYRSIISSLSHLANEKEFQEMLKE